MISDNLGLLLFYNSQELYDDDALAAQGCLHIIANLIGLPFLLKLETAIMIPIHRVSFIHRATYFPTFSLSIFVFKVFSHVTLLANFAFFFCYQNRSHLILAASQKYVLSEPRIAAPHKLYVLKSFFLHINPRSFILILSLSGLISAHYSLLHPLCSPLLYRAVSGTGWHTLPNVGDIRSEP